MFYTTANVLSKNRSWKDITIVFVEENMVDLAQAVIRGSITALYIGGHLDYLCTGIFLL